MLRVQRDHDAPKLRPLALVNRQYIRQAQLVESAKPYLTVVRLTEICRQASQSRIVTAALRSLDIKRLQSRVEWSRSGLSQSLRSCKDARQDTADPNRLSSGAPSNGPHRTAAAWHCETVSI